jgi:hypothetical protein
VGHLSKGKAKSKGKCSRKGRLRRGNSKSVPKSVKQKSRSRSKKPKSRANNNNTKGPKPKTRGRDKSPQRRSFKLQTKDRKLEEQNLIAEAMLIKEKLNEVRLKKLRSISKENPKVAQNKDDLISIISPPTPQHQAELVMETPDKNWHKRVQKN